MNLQLSRSEAATELIHRRSIRRSLTEFARLCGFEPASHHQLLIGLEKVARGETPRLAVFMPPGSAKSTYASKLFAAWFMANASGQCAGRLAYTELAEKWGRWVRNCINEHSLTLGISPCPDSQAAGVGR
jgi:hypothetical protein